MSEGMDTQYFLVILLLTVGLLLPLLVFLLRALKDILPYLYVTARIRAKEARLIKNEALDEMINTGSVAEIASMLENSEYALAMQGLVLDSAESIEELLIRQTAEIYSEVANMVPERDSRVFSYLRQQWDVRNLKAIMRGVRAGRPAEAIMAATVHFGELDPEMLKKMAEANSIEDLLPLFEGTPYEELAALLPAYEQEKSLLPLEARLDAIVLESMWRSVTAQRELGCLRPGFAARIDALNLKIVFRAKRDHLMLGDVEKYLIAGGDIPKAFYAAMDEVDEVGALVAELENTVFYKPLMDVMQEYDKSGSVYDLEKVLEETALGVGRQSAIKQPYGIAPVLGFLTLKETEMRNIRAISRAKEAGMAPETIREFVLRV